MALSECKECGKVVSTLAETCPNCGVSKPAKKIQKADKMNKQEFAQELSVLEISEHVKDPKIHEAWDEALKEYKKSLAKGEIQIGDHLYNRTTYLKHLRELAKNMKKLQPKRFGNMNLNFKHFTPYWDTIPRFPTDNEGIINAFFQDRKLHVLEGIWQEEEWGVIAVVKEGNKFQRYAIDINHEQYEKTMKRYLTFEKLNGTKDGVFLKTSQKNTYKVMIRACWMVNPDAEFLGEQMVFKPEEATLKIINENKLIEKSKTKYMKKSRIYTRIWPKRFKEYNKEIPINKTSNEPVKREENLRSTTPSQSTNKAEKDTFEKFSAGELDLATSFWGFLFAGGLVVGFVCGFLSGAYGKGWYIPLIGYTIFVIQGTWQSAEKYKIEQKKKKQSEVWGFLAQVVCVLNGISIIGMIAEFF